ncbi:DUF4232 domain-containing protein [Actinomadura graeca]|uniref:DUF4232 domain-containing protein n=1 Tax=Actinomadura graeca TaxID=2750812 RepID=A0ABX8R010_9ACTN|nr:DUF4232 domain-containing protein [Actinomadura graeca]QXJ24390.1 DUF4232 domain-containing protein [Actinomadura graeca]
MHRIIWGTLAAAALATSLTACGSSSNAGTTSAGGTQPTSPGTPLSDGPTTGTPGAGAPGAGTPGASAGAGGNGHGTGAGGLRCTTPMLTASLTGYDAGAGQRYLTLVLTSKSSKPCTTGGWSGLALAGPDGPVPTQVVREGTARTITLPPGGSAYQKLHWTVAPAYDEDEETCRPTATTLRVIPPNETTRLTVPWKYGQVCQHGRIRTTPLSLTR